MKGLRSTPPKKQGPPILEEKKRILQRNSLVPRTTLGTGLARSTMNVTTKLPRTTLTGHGTSGLARTGTT